MKKRSKSETYFQKYLKKMAPVVKEKNAEEIFNALKNGKNSYMRIDRLETSSYDMTWINAIENCIYDLGEIVNNPRETTKTTANLVPVELAKKINSESVQHLASHTQYIKEIDEKGNVVPNKILSINNEEELHTYENRFIATLIRRLVLFIEKRYEFVKQFAHLHDEEILYFKNKSIVNGEEVEIETKIKVKSESETKAAEKSNSYFDRVEKIREYILYYYGSHFMKIMKTDKDVRNPILMTNILRKNPKYHHCYELYRFIEKYDQLGVSYRVDEDASIFSETEMNELNTLMFTNFVALKNKDKSKQSKRVSKVYKPKILTSIDDEPFIYGDLLKGPIQFVRMDEDYQAYLDSKLKNDLPERPTKLEKEYYKDEYAERKENKADRIAKEKLDKRKKKEAIEFDKKAKAIIAQREKEEQERIRREQELLRQEEERRVEAIRQELIKSAMSDASENEEFSEKTANNPVNDEILEEEVAETPIEEEVPTQVEEPVLDAAPVQEEVAPEEIPQPVEESVEEPKEEVVEQQTEESTNEQQVDVVIPVEEQPVEEEPVPEQAEEEPLTETPLELEPELVSEEPVQEQVEEFVPNEEPASKEVIPEPVPAPVEKEKEEPVEEAKEPSKEEKDLEELRRQLVESAKEDSLSENKVEEPAPEVVEEPHKEETAPQQEADVSFVMDGNEHHNPFEGHHLGGSKGPRFIKVKKKHQVEEEVEDEQPVQREKIPGKFVVKAMGGYYVSEETFSVYKSDAYIFDDFNLANDIKMAYGGKVVKL